MAARDRGGAELVKEVFGVNLQEQGRGFYVALELLAIARGVVNHSPENLLDPDESPIRIDRISHDIARRIAVGSDVDREKLDEALQGASTHETLEALFASLIVEIPGRRKAPRWFAAHLYPFVGELVHYDAVERRGKPAIERYFFRDGGGWAYYVLRTDRDTSRRNATRNAMKDLVGNSNTSLGRVAAALSSHDSARSLPFDELSESETQSFDSVSPWPDLLRSGINSIVTRVGAPRAQRIERLMHWVPYCLARHQLHLARRHQGFDREAILVDATRNTNPLRRGSQEQLEAFRGQIVAALISHAVKKHADAAESGDDQDVSRWETYTSANANYTKSPRAFFSESLAAVGALNSTVGRRHFTFKPPLLESVVSALIPPNTEVEYYDFCARLFAELGIVIDDRSAGKAGFTSSIDAGVFVLNSDAFKARLRSIGLLTHYSDATSIVHGDQR